MSYCMGEKANYKRCLIKKLPSNDMLEPFLHLWILLQLGKVIANSSYAYFKHWDTFYEQSFFSSPFLKPDQKTQVKNSYMIALNTAYNIGIFKFRKRCLLEASVIIFLITGYITTEHVLKQQKRESLREFYWGHFCLKSPKLTLACARSFTSTSLSRDMKIYFISNVLQRKNV